MNEAEVVEGMVVVADDQSAEVTKPSEESLHLPPTSIPPVWTPILGLGADRAPAMRRNDLPPERCQREVQGLGVIGTVAYEPPWRPSHAPTTCSGSAGTPSWRSLHVR